MQREFHVRGDYVVRELGLGVGSRSIRTTRRQFGNLSLIDYDDK
jgi:hypothetical protein